MKYMIVVILTPIYIIIHIFKWMIEASLIIGEAITEPIIKSLENMNEFWKKIFKW